METNKMKMWKKPKSIGRLTTALFLCTVILLNIAIYIVTIKCSLYFYTTETYTHTISGKCQEKIEELPSKVSIRYCMSKEELEQNPIYNLVYQTSLQYAEQNPDKIVIEKPFNIYTDYAQVKAYADEFDVTIKNTCVIIESDIEKRILDMSDFFGLNTNQEIEFYNGEEVFAAMFFWVQTKAEDHPKAYFTTDHGEDFSIRGLTMQLLMAGYQMDTLELSSENVPEDCKLLILANPIYDFEKAADGSLATSEIDRLTSYLEKGGNVYLFLDGASETYTHVDTEGNVSTKIPNLREFIAQYGMNLQNDLVYDYTNSLTQSGKSILAEYADNTYAKAYEAKVKNYNADSRMVISNTSYMTVAQDNSQGATVYPLLNSMSTSEAAGKKGNYTLVAMATKGKAHLMVALNTTMTYSEMMDNQNYSNQEFFYVMLEEYGDCTAPAGCTTMFIENESLHNLTVGESNRAFVIMVIVIPVCLFLACAFVLIRRKRR